MMQICDGRDDCDFFGSEPSTYHTWIGFLKRDQSVTAYIHVSRCREGSTSINATAPLSGGVYKICRGLNDGIDPIATYKLPPFLCEQACDKNPACTIFTVDEVGQTCWLSKNNDDDLRTLYVKMR